MAQHTRSLIPSVAIAVALYFANGSHVPLDSTPIVFGPRNPIELKLELRAASVKERDELPTLAAGGKSPNVRPYRTLSIRFLVGRSQPFYFLADHFGLIGRASDKNWEGTYRIQARYQNLQSPPIFVTIR